jgi:flagellar basal body-associated protein FliL
MNRKLLVPILALVLILGAAFAAYSVAKPKHNSKIKIDGTTYILPKQFTINLRSGQYATLTVALLLPPGQSVGTTSPNDPPPSGFGSLTDEAEIRAIITNDVTDQSENALITESGRQALEAKILADINAQTDTKVSAIYFTDLAVQ